MVTKVSGTAIVPDYYITQDGKIVRIRTNDIESAVANSNILKYVDKHIDDTTDDIKGIVTSTNVGSTGLDFEAVLTDSKLESHMVTKLDNGEIPNVSVKMVPTPEAKFTQMNDGNGEYTVADDWELLHISNVEEGRCTPEDGCGAFSYDLQLNSISLNETADTGEQMTGEECIEKKLAAAEVELEKLELKLTAELSKNESIENELNQLKKQNEETILELTAATDELLSYKEADIEQSKTAILKLDSEHPFTGKETKAELELVLNTLRRSSERRKANTSTEEPDETISAIGEFRDNFMKPTRLRRA